MAEKAKKDQVMDALEKVIDPELGIDIVNLGLIYEVEIKNDNQATITITLTTMGCPLSDMLNDAIKQAAKSVSGITEVEIELVWYPIWDISKMSRYARVALGIPEGFGV
ncbi:metal-sulfur cluster assembly factor [Companilactobacillus halodurans]|uniref:Metal-sulfur cluster assembly factor n=1 Tax=Companilactobacillus halodurans TaxID=2584183 RepID=A0A5P0ZWK9_9LACO|nr:metal-sulfur cluster assembly factor [Companilactobacillus halodurans]MQS75479.1 metal-sulfur cluster assembly factor [Companilactobacillus halodurans]MQS97473.1 metal-sulfur cluster assembly factor [Companilactobacillus halodurans]